MKKESALAKNLFLDIVFPKFCLNCQKEGSYLCEDCLSLLGVLEYQYCPGCHTLVQDGKTCPNCKKYTKLNGLYCALPYQNKLAKKIIAAFKYEPFVKELSKTLASLIIAHFQLLNKKPNFSNFILIPVPLHQKRLRWRGFNQSEAIAKELSNFLRISAVSNVLLKTKETLPQAELKNLERQENIKGAFVIKNPEKLRGRKVLLIDDVYTTGATMTECSRLLKEGGVKEVWGIAAARG